MSKSNEPYLNPQTTYFGEPIDEIEYGCKLDDMERSELDELKRRIKRRICTIIDEEIKLAVYKHKTGKDYF